jgi:hypothetical protein
MSEANTLLIRETTNYRMFRPHDIENRGLDLRKHKRLLESMREYGFLPCYPIVCYRRPADVKLYVKDGQHRLTIAESLDLPAWWVEVKVDFNVAKVNGTPVPWRLRDFANKYATNGVKSYREGVDFAEAHGLPVGIAFAMLSGCTKFSACQDAFVNGNFKVKDRDWAAAVADIYAPLTRLEPRLKNARCLDACMAVCRVPDFDARRLLQGAERCRERLVPYATRDAHLDMLEQVYNYGRRQMFGLKVAALNAMRERNPRLGRKARGANGQADKSNAKDGDKA